MECFYVFDFGFPVELFYSSVQMDWVWIRVVLAIGMGWSNRRTKWLQLVCRGCGQEIIGDRERGGRPQMKISMTSQHCVVGGGCYA